MSGSELPTDEQIRARRAEVAARIKRLPPIETMNARLAEVRAEIERHVSKAERAIDRGESVDQEAVRRTCRPLVDERNQLEDDIWMAELRQRRT